MAFGEILGKKTGHFSCTPIFGKLTLLPCILIVFWMIYSYFYNIYNKYSYYWIITLGLMFFMTYRYSAVLTHFLIKGNQTANHINKDVIGSVMSYSLLLGIAAGNLISLTFPFIKNRFF